ncbi:unnamed protein product [Urochloa humidicola]
MTKEEDKGGGTQHHHFSPPTMVTTSPRTSTSPSTSARCCSPPTVAGSDSGGQVMASCGAPSVGADEARGSVGDARAGRGRSGGDAMATGGRSGNGGAMAARLGARAAATLWQPAGAWVGGRLGQQHGGPRDDSGRPGAGWMELHMEMMKLGDWRGSWVAGGRR